MTMSDSYICSHDERGSSLIEVLISLVLVAVTMLGLLGLQLRTLGLQKDSLDRRNAATLVAGFSDRIAGNFAGFEAGNYDALSMGIGDPTPVSSTLASCVDADRCTNAEVGARDWDAFRLAVRKRLPDGVAFVTIGAGRTAVIVTVGWVDPQRVAAFSSGNAVAANTDCVAVGINDTRYHCYVASVYP